MFESYFRMLAIIPVYLFLNVLFTFLFTYRIMLAVSVLEQKADNQISLTSHHFFHCLICYCLPQNLHGLCCHIKLTLLLTFYVF